ncbi:MAG TPA: hypothetical protein VFX53_04530 [Pedococcus sp.]|nr:hypothetical protein [Pedococcus sp.]
MPLRCSLVVSLAILLIGAPPALWFVALVVLVASAPLVVAWLWASRDD